MSHHRARYVCGVLCGVLFAGCLLIAPAVAQSSGTDSPPLVALHHATIGDALQSFQRDPRPVPERVASYWDVITRFAQPISEGGSAEPRASQWLIRNAELRFAAPGEAETYLTDLLSSPGDPSPNDWIFAARAFQETDRQLAFLESILLTIPDRARQGEWLEACSQRFSRGRTRDPLVRQTIDLRLIHEYGDVPKASSTIGALARARLGLDLEGLPSEGQLAPEVIGTTLEGTELRLSDFRGRRVILRFFTDTWKSCRGDYSLERSLVELDPELVLIGISCDRDKEKLELSIAEHGLRFPIIFDGGLEPGPITTRWGAGNTTAIEINPAGRIEGRYRVKKLSGESCDDSGGRLLSKIRD